MEKADILPMRPNLRRSKTMIEKTTILNFQKHRKLTLEFSPYVTTLIGPNDVGKSTILRALKWVCFNRVPDSNFIHWDANLAKVSIIVDERKIIRKLGKGINTYFLDGKKYKALQVGVVPEPIANLINIGKINWQDQAEGHFWFSLTPGQVSKELNQIINLGAIDSTLANISSEIRESNTENKIILNRIKGLKERKKELDWIQDANKDLVLMESKEKQLYLDRSRILKLEYIINKARLLSQEIQEAREVILEASKLWQWQNELIAVESDMIFLESNLKKMKGLNHLIQMDLPDMSNMPMIKSLMDKNRSLSKLISDIQYWEEEKCRTHQEVSQKELELHKMLKGKKCPVCKQIIRT